MPPVTSVQMVETGLMDPRARTARRADVMPAPSEPQLKAADSC